MTELVDKFIGDAGFKAGMKLCGPVCGDIGSRLATTGSRLLRDKLKKKFKRVGVLPGTRAKKTNAGGSKANGELGRDLYKTPQILK